MSKPKRGRNQFRRWFLYTFELPTSADYATMRAALEDAFREPVEFAEWLAAKLGLPPDSDFAALRAELERRLSIEP